MWIKCIFIALVLLSIESSSIVAQGLDFGDVAVTENIQTESSQYPYRVLANSVIFPSLFLIIMGCLWLVFSKKDDEKSLHKRFCLFTLPLSAKGAMTLVWFAYGLVHLFAVATVYLKTNVVYDSTIEYFFYMPAHRLTALSHAHFFGHATMYLLTASFFLFTTLPERLKRGVIVLAPLGAILDNTAWWGMKLSSHYYEIISFGAGAMMSIGFAVMAIVACRQMWSSKYLKKENNA